MFLLDTNVMSELRRPDKADARVFGWAARAWLDGQVLPQFDGRILPVNAPVALQCARLHVPDPRSHRNAMIAATALVHGMTVATRNVSDFAPTGVRTFNPWTEG